MKNKKTVDTDDFALERDELLAEIARLKSVEEENRHLNRALEISELKFDKIVENIPDIFYMLDNNGVITYISDTVIQYGYNPKELVGKALIDLVHPDDRDTGRYRINERRTPPRNTRCYELRLFTKNHTLVPFEIKTRLFSTEPVFEISAEGLYNKASHDNSFLGTIGIARDISERKKAEDAIAKYRQELELEVESFKTLVGDLNQIGIALSSEHSIGKLLDMIVTELRSFTRSDGGSLYIKENEQLTFAVAQNDTLKKMHGSVPFKSFTIPIDHKSIAGYVASTGEVMNISDLDKIGDEYPFSLKTMREFDEIMGYKSVSMLVAPMRNHRDEIIGVIQLINALDQKGQPIAFNSEMEELVISLASQAAVSICNSRFIQEIKNLFESIVTYSAQAIDARSPHTAGHSNRVAQLVLLQAKAINEEKDGPFADVAFSDEELNELRIASFLHDIGKIGVPERVLDKVNKLSDEKMEAIKNRFAFIKRDLRAVICERLSTENDVSEAQKRLDEINDDLKVIESLNKPRYYSDEEGEHINRIAQKSYVDSEGIEHPCLEPEEVEPLLVRRGNLTAQERKEIENHVNHTLKILEKIPFTNELKNVPVIAATHHEMLNGTGYPNKLTSENIPLQARMLAIADIYDALTAKDRPYKPPLPLNVTLKILREDAENGRLDKDVVDLFIRQEIYKFME